MELKGFEEAEIRDALRASRILDSKKPFSSFKVRDTGFEPVAFPTSRGRSTN